MNQPLWRGETSPTPENGPENGPESEPTTLEGGNVSNSKKWTNQKQTAAKYQEKSQHRRSI